MNLKFTRKINSHNSQITIPKCISDMWADFNNVDIIFDGDCLVITPARN